MDFDVRADYVPKHRFGVWVTRQLGGSGQMRLDIISGPDALPFTGETSVCCAIERALGRVRFGNACGLRDKFVFPQFRNRRLVPSSGRVSEETFQYKVTVAVHIQSSVGIYCDDGLVDRTKSNSQASAVQCIH